MKSSPQHVEMDLRLAKTHATSPINNNNNNTPSSRILYDIPCRVCQDHSSGKHYGIFACDGCAGFFKRSIRRNRQYVCKAKSEGSCVVDKTHRNQCRACRLRKCVQVGMNKDAVQHERGPRNSTLRRQMSMFYATSKSGGSSENGDSPPPPTPPAPAPAAPVQPTPVAPRQTSPCLSDVNHLTLAEHMAMIHRSNGLLCAPQPKYAHETAFAAPPVVSAWSFTPETICESAARLLFMNVRWAKSVPAFTALPARDQIVLLEESWRELFVLGAAQFMLPIEAGTLMAALGLSNSPYASLASRGGMCSVSTERQLGLLSEIKTFQETVAKFKQMNVDATEYACLRAVILFKTSAGLHDIPAAISLQDQAQLTLSRYVVTAYPTQQLRFGRLLLLLPALRAIAASTIEELFFRKTIGNIPIERIISDMYKSGDL